MLDDYFGALVPTIIEATQRRAHGLRIVKSVLDDPISPGQTVRVNREPILMDRKVTAAIRFRSPRYKLILASADGLLCNLMRQIRQKTDASRGIVCAAQPPPSLHMTTRLIKYVHVNWSGMPLRLIASTDPYLGGLAVSIDTLYGVAHA